MFIKLTRIEEDGTECPFFQNTDSIDRFDVEDKIKLILKEEDLEGRELYFTLKNTLEDIDMKLQKLKLRYV